MTLKKEPEDADIIIVGASEVIGCGPAGAPVARTRAKDFSVIRDGAVAIRGDRIAAVGTTAAITAAYRGRTVIDAAGKMVSPGFVDPHTHLVYGGSRHGEWEDRVTGRPQKSLDAGIRFTLEQTRAAPTEVLAAQARADLDTALAHGTTTLEAKSGYGLDRDNELRLLAVVDSLRGHPVDLVSTYLGAHVLPADYVDRRDQYVDLVVRTLPEAAELAEYCDVCVDPVGFTPAEAQRIADRAADLGMGIRVHADQTGRAGGARFAAENRAASADHLDFASREDLTLMAEASTVAVVLPSLNYHLLELTPGLNGEPPAKGFFPGVVATMLDVGLRVALSTDYNPGTSPNVSMQAVMQLAARFYRLDYGQIWQMATIDAAVALGRGHDRGSVEAGKLADLVIWQVPEHGMVINRFGTNLAGLVIKSGSVVSTGSRSPAGS
jgi:imidazolonepropionase